MFSKPTPEREEFSEFYRQTATAAFRIAQRSARCRQDAEDAMHEAYLKVMALWPAWRGRDRKARFAGLRVILARSIIDLYRKKYFTAEVLSGDPFDTWPMQTQRTEERDWEAAAAYRQVCIAIASMPPRRREVATLFWIAGFERDEVASALNISRGTVRVHLRDALHDLKQSEAGTLIGAFLSDQGAV